MKKQAVPDISDHIVPVLRDVQAKVMPTALDDILSLSIHAEIASGIQQGEQNV